MRICNHCNLLLEGWGGDYNEKITLKITKKNIFYFLITFQAAICSREDNSIENLLLSRVRCGNIIEDEWLR